MRTSLKTAIGIITLAIVAGAVYAGVGVHGDRAKPGAGACCMTAPTTESRLTLDPSLFSGKVREAYIAAQQHPEILAQLHCYCGCEHAEGHHNLLDCFRNRHAESCEICTGEAIMAARMTGQGMPVEQLQDAVRARYAHGG